MEISDTQEATAAEVLDHIYNVHERPDLQTLRGLFASESATNSALKPFFREYVLLQLVLGFLSLLLLLCPPLFGACLTDSVRTRVATNAVCQLPRHKHSLARYVPECDNLIKANRALQLEANRFDHAMKTVLWQRVSSLVRLLVRTHQHAHESHADAGATEFLSAIRPQTP